MSKGINQVINLRSHGWSNKIYVVMPIFVKLLKFFSSGHGVRAVLRTTQLISLLVWSKRTICTRLRNSQVIPFFRPNPFNQTLIIILWWGSNPINQLYYPCVRLWIHHMAYTKYTPDSVKPTLEFHINYQSRSICLELFFKDRSLYKNQLSWDIGKELIDLSLNLLTRNWAKNSSSPCQYPTDLIFLLKNS